MNRSVLFILMPEGYQETEFNTPYNALVKAGFTVDVAGLKEGPATGHQKNVFSPNKLLSKLSTQDFDQYEGLIIPGGPGSETHLWGNEAIQRAIEYFHKNNKLVATICNACIPAAQAGILSEKPATVYPTDEGFAIYKKHNVELIDAGCVCLDDEKIITARGPADAENFTKDIIRILG